MKKIIISPYSKKPRKTKPTDPDKINPKNYPFWNLVVVKLKAKGYHVIQVGVAGEEPIGANEIKSNLSIKDLKELLMSCSTWASVDNFFNHFATYYGKKGVVIFGRSDPEIYGYAQNINLLKDRSCLRVDQFGLWESDEFRRDVFVDSDIVIDAIEKLSEQN
jgi:ADP-heptose:LPS heptosyltransferase